MKPTVSAPTGPAWLSRLNDRFGRRTVGIVAAIAAELVIVLLLLTLSRGEPPPRPPLESVTAFDVSAAKPDQAPPARESPRPEPSQAAQPPTPTRPAPPAPPRPTPAIVLPDTPAAPPPATPEPQPSSPPAPRQSQPAPPARKGAMQGPMLGASAAGNANDTPVVGTAPDGKPLYAARWYREPTEQELAGYLSTASGPGWGLIACKTAPQYRVEDCVPLSESPQGANINRAILAAAWQFRVRPPRIGGRYLVGSWVRIRIDYRQRGA